MSEQQSVENENPNNAQSTPSIEVRVYRHDELIESQLCESDEEAAEVVEQWSEVDDVTCLVDDLSYHHEPGDVLEPELAEPADEDYPREPTAESTSEP